MRLLLLASLLMTAVPTLAQPRIDPAFLPAAIYQPAPVWAVLQLGSGARVVAGAIRQADGQPANNLVRYLPNGTLDATFAANVASYQWQADKLVEAPGGKVLVLKNGNGLSPTAPVSGAAGGSLVRLHADGTVDTTFSVVGRFSGSIYALLVQPDGKVVLGGQFGLTATPAVRNLMRLNADGTSDAGFVAAGSGPDRSVAALALQPDGKLLVGGQFGTLHGLAVPVLARLLPSGALDPNFGIRTTPGTSQVTAIAVQPGGRIVVGGTQPLSSSSSHLVRIESTGAYDATFQSSLGSAPRQVQALPTGQLLVQDAFRHLRRLQANGAPDGTFQPPPGLDVEAWQGVPGGQVLVGSQANFYAGPAFRLGALLLGASGSPDLSFTPRVQGPGQVADMALQADGRIIIGGDFEEVNGTLAHGLTRLLPDGTVDATYAPQTPVGTAVGTLALQPDGRLLVAGNFASLGGSARPGLARLLPDGTVDATFAPPAGSQLGNTAQLALLATGQVLVRVGGALRRFSATGQPDATFVFPPAATARLFIAQPDGSVVVAGSFPQNGPILPLVRLLPTGTLDPSFTFFTFSNLVFISSLALYPDGRLLVGGLLGQAGGALSGQVLRLFPNGSTDYSFASFSNAAGASSLVIQPNQRVLVGGQVFVVTPTSFAVAGTERLLADGALDPSYAAVQGPGDVVYKLLIQPDGKILAAGSFTTVSGLPILGLTRLLDPNVLSISAASRAVTLTAWPIPARTTLHLALDAAARPRQVQLLDALGRVVLTQAAVPNMMLDVRGLAPGPYVLRVDYATGPVLRRVVVE